MAVAVSATDNAHHWGPALAVVSMALAHVLCYALNPHSWLFRRVLSRLRVPRLLFITNRAVHVSKHDPPTRYWTFDQLDPRHLVHCPLLGTRGLLALHAATALYFVATVLVDVGVDHYGWGCRYPGCHRSGAHVGWMTYLTNWSLSILGIAGLVAFINTARFARARSRQRHGQDAHTRAGQLHAAQQQQVAEELRGGAGSGADATRGSKPDQLPVLAQPPRHKAPAAGAEAPAPAAPSSSSTSSSDCPSICAHVDHHHHKHGLHNPDSSHAATVVTVRNGSSSSDTPGVGQLPPAQWDWLSRLHCLLMEVATTAAFFVSFWFWVGLGPIAGDDFNTNPGTVMAHAGNLGVALLQLLLTRLPLVSTHFQVLLIYATLYEVFLWAFGEGAGVWRYGLNWRKATPAGALILLPLIVFIMWAIWFLIARARESVLHRRVRRRQRRLAHVHTAGGRQQPGQPRALHPQHQRQHAVPQQQHVVTPTAGGSV